MASSGKRMVCVGRRARCASVAVVGVFVSWVSLGVGDASAATMTFNSPSSSLIVVPAGVTSMTATVTGAAGGACGAMKGGLGASVTATVPVLPAQQLFVGVGSAGGACGPAGGSGGIGGGGDGGQKLLSGAGAAGGGGGSLIAQVAVGFPGFGNGALLAAGGGGGAGAQRCPTGTNAGGNADSPGGAPGGASGRIDSGGPGGAGGDSAAGEGGAAPSETGILIPTVAGDSGSFNDGGDGGTAFFAGGGGGGGLWGGGGGGPGYSSGCGAGGGGGGSFVASGATGVKGPAATASAPQVVITFAAAGVGLSSPSTEVLKCKTVHATEVCRRTTAEVPTGSGGSRSAKISRGHKVYATGASVPTGHGTSDLVLTSDRKLKPGHYTLTLSRRHGHHEITRKLALTLS